MEAILYSIQEKRETEKSIEHFKTITEEELSAELFDYCFGKFAHINSTNCAPSLKLHFTKQ